MDMDEQMQMIIAHIINRTWDNTSGTKHSLLLKQNMKEKGNFEQIISLDLTYVYSGAILKACYVSWWKQRGNTVHFLDPSSDLGLYEDSKETRNEPM